MDVMKNQRRCKLIKEEVMNTILMRQQQPQTCEQLKQNLKDLGMWVKSDQDPPGTFHSPMSCVVSKVFIKNDMNVKKGKRLLVLRAPLPPPSNPPLSFLSPMPESQKRRIKKILIDQLQSTRSAATAHPEDEDTTPIPMETSRAVDKMDALELYKNFKKFDIVADHSDHYFSAQAETEQLPTDWVNRIQQERRILEEHLPDTIFVRVYESRMDILRAAIIGLKGTPYHDGLFFFDVCFPSNYPHSPPLVHYRFGGVCGINPHVNKAGDVRLSFRNADSKLEKMWAPRTSNMLQLLVSIQCLIFNARPYFNGLANAKLRGDVTAERWSFLFNENTVIKSLKTMTYTMNNPPKNFENLVVGHFHKHVCIILRACRDYWNDWNTKRCLIGDENHKRSIKFVRDIASCSKSLLEAFDRIGAKKAQRYLCLTECKTSSAKAPSSVPEDINFAAKGKRKVDGDSHDASRKKKVAVDGASDSAKHQENKCKEKVDKYAHHSKITIKAPMNCRISKLFTNAGEEVKRGQPLFELGERSFEDLLSDVKIKNAKIAKVNAKAKIANAKIAKAKIAKSKVKKNSVTRKILLANRCSRVGIFNMEDVLVEKVQDDSSPMAVGLGNEEGDVLKNYENFKKFDHVLDISDHYFSAEEFAVTQPSEEWTNKIREEWAMLEDQLPETIFVRVNESRMDLLRAVIIGREGTPYWNGLFFFDVCFPSNYPNSAPLVHYHSGGLLINPNLKKSGEVGLSLPKTSGGQEMMWVPGNSTILELLVSIQKRILTRYPLFNEPTYAILKSSFFGEQSSILYNENTVVRSLKQMVYLINKPPKNFEHFVVGHFHNRARDIMVTCNKRKIPSMTFKKDLALCSKLLLAAFDKIGAKLPEEIIP